MSQTRFEIRPFTDDEFPAAHELLAEVFHEAFSEADLAAERGVLRAQRTQAAYDGQQMVGCLATFDHEYSVPGGSVQGAGTTWVGVKPTHRRQGLLNAMMRAHLDEAVASGDAIAVLWASESAIYGRFGYGLASESMVTTLDSSPGLEWRDDLEIPPTQFRSLSVDDAAPAVAPIYDAVRIQRAGMHARSPKWWTFQVLSSRAATKNGESKKRVVVASREGQDVGYAVYGGKGTWGASGHEGQVNVTELAAIDAPGEIALWQFLAGIDLTVTVKTFRRPVDDALPWALENPRRALRQPTDALHVRILDLEKALSARSYAASAGVTVELHDPMFDANDGTWRIEVASEGVMVAPTDESADLRMGIRELGSLYFGADYATRLARLGLIDVRNPDALAALDDAMRTPLAPWGPEVW